MQHGFGRVTEIYRGLRPSNGARGHRVDVGSTGGDEGRSCLWESNGSGTHFWTDHGCDQAPDPTLLDDLERDLGTQVDVSSDV